ncbi:MAG: ABC transporter substrate-binding protein [Clostridiales bacterium]|nr:ABC transporter substrate-binding protein [Clostridiales bacterium]
MSKKLCSLFLAALMVCCAVPVPAEGPAVAVTDMMGREIVLDAPVTRIVALTAADCEILCALGCEDVLVGRGEYCDYPASVLDKPSVQSGYETNLEQIIALQPQVVLMGTMAQTVEQVEALEQAGIRVVVSDAQNIEGVYTAIRMIGALTGKDAEAEAIVADMQAGFAEIAERSQDTGKTVYFEVSPLQWGLWAAGKGTFMDEIAGLCGLTNLFEDMDGWVEVSEETVLARNPDYIVTTAMYFGEGPTPVEEILSRDGWERLDAVMNDGIFNADSNAITRPGPRLLEAAWALYEFVNGEAAEEPAA